MNGRKPGNQGSGNKLEFNVEKEHRRMDAGLFMLWAFLGVISILFAGLALALVLSGLQSSTSFGEPDWFYAFTASILLSSLTLHASVICVRDDLLMRFRSWLGGTILLALTFITGQVLGWHEYYSDGMNMRSVHAVALLYILSGTHALHVLGGLIWVLSIGYTALRNRVHPRRLRGVYMFATYWHYLDLLWLLLFILLLLFV